ncbi:hypothetical protein LVD17_07200 [Fulvivirga ulvae]|uniref:hypothetical protein n=1 Tax=Fulvivirga ulvae TaxID=2904245 RepID=UPI001F18C0A1|nr:hypothetical protein [Fulvivirga ulvae]UII33604.1 hypothetical protein LVD17_07200 [Fulvivirga ulvae]
MAREILFTSLAPFQLNGEQAKLIYTIEPRDKKYNLQSYSSEILFPGKTKTFFTVGMAFYGATLSDEAYSISTETAVDGTITHQLVNEDLSKIEMGMAALLRGGKRLENKNLSLQFAFGPGVSITNKMRPRFLIGGGFSYGNKHRVAVDTGLIIGEVNRLSQQVRKGGVNKSTSQLTVSDLKVGGFLSLGYHFNF